MRGLGYPSNQPGGRPGYPPGGDTRCTGDTSRLRCSGPGRARTPRLMPGLLPGSGQPLWCEQSRTLPPGLPLGARPGPPALLSDRGTHKLGYALLGSWWTRMSSGLVVPRMRGSQLLRSGRVLGYALLARCSG